MSRTPSRPLLLALLMVASLSGFGDALAQPTPPHGNIDAGVGDVPAGSGAILGRVVHRVGRGGVEGVPVRLFALGMDGRPGMRQEETGTGGTFRFEDISTHPGTFYLIAVEYGEVPFGTRLTFEADERKLTPVIEVAETSTDATALEVGAVRLRLDRGCAGVRVRETHVLRNPTEYVLYVPKSERATRLPLYETNLPATAASASSATPGRNMPEGALEQRGDGVGYWGPLYPGEQVIDFSYSLTGSDGKLAVERHFQLGAERVTVLTFWEAPPARGESLRPAAEQTLDDIRYAAVERGAIAPDAPFAFTWDLTNSEPDAAPPPMREAKMWLELDDAALDVREEYLFVVAGSESLRSRSDVPLLCLPLPPEAEGLRFSTEAFAMGVEPGVAGTIALRGPIPPGRSGFALSYLLRSHENHVRLTRSFGTHLSRLSMLVADNGVLTESDRLHNRRPARTTDRTYLQLEGFEIEPDETVTVDLTSLEPQQPLPRGAAIGFVTASALLSVFFLVAPLREPRTESARAAVAAASVDERSAVYASIRDLEDDFDTGKISGEDRAVMLAELRAHAGELLRQERILLASESAATPPAACGSCRTVLPPDARFCAQCGVPVDSQPSAPETHG